MGGAGRQRTEPAFLRRKAFWPIKMKYAGPRLNLRDAPKVVRMLCSPVQSGTSGHPTLAIKKVNMLEILQKYTVKYIIYEY